MSVDVVARDLTGHELSRRRFRWRWRARRWVGRQPAAWPWPYGPPLFDHTIEAPR